MKSSEVRRNCYKNMRPPVFPEEGPVTTLHNAVESSLYTNMATNKASTELLLTEVSTLLCSTIVILLYILILRGEPKPYSYWLTRKLNSSTFVYRRGNS